MKELCFIYITLYLALYVMYTQFYKVATRKCKNTSALTVLLRFTSGISILLALPLFEFKVPHSISTYLFLFLACIFFALSDRMYTASLKELEVSTYSILAQLSTVFIFILGVIFFKEALTVKKLIGASLILFANVFVLYKKKKIKWNKYYIFNIIANLSFAIGTTLNIGISEEFNLPFYIAITLCGSAILIFIFERIKIKDILREFNEGEKTPIIIVSILDGITSLLLLRAYQIESVTVVAPLISLKTVLNVFVARLALKEKTSTLKKVIAALIIIIGVILLNI